MKYPSQRLVFFIVFVGTCLLMGVGFFMQYVLKLEPCPLCITQRFFIVLCGIFALGAALHNPERTGARVYGFLVTCSALVGAGFSSRQLYLQSLPPEQAPACGPSIQYMFETFPLTEALSLLLRGDGNCAEVLWTFLGISIPGWTLVAFAGLALIGVSEALNLGKR